MEEEGEGVGAGAGEDFKLAMRSWTLPLFTAPPLLA